MKFIHYHIILWYWIYILIFCKKQIYQISVKVKLLQITYFIYKTFNNLVCSPCYRWRHWLNYHSHFKSTEKTTNSILAKYFLYCVSNISISNFHYFLRWNIHFNFPIVLSFNFIQKRIINDMIFSHFAYIPFLTCITQTSLCIKSSFDNI
jgi:hypothetical protein